MLFSFSLSYSIRMLYLSLQVSGGYLLQVSSRNLLTGDKYLVDTYLANLSTVLPSFV